MVRGGGIFTRLNVPSMPPYLALADRVRPLRLTVVAPRRRAPRGVGKFVAELPQTDVTKRVADRRGRGLLPDVSSATRGGKAVLAQVGRGLTPSELSARLAQVARVGFPATPRRLGLGGLAGSSPGHTGAASRGHLRQNSIPSIVRDLAQTVRHSGKLASAIKARVVTDSAPLSGSFLARSEENAIVQAELKRTLKPEDRQDFTPARVASEHSQSKHAVTMSAPESLQRHPTPQAPKNIGTPGMPTVSVISRTRWTVARSATAYVRRQGQDTTVDAIRGQSLSALQQFAPNHLRQSARFWPTRLNRVGVDRRRPHTTFLSRDKTLRSDAMKESPPRSGPTSVTHVRQSGSTDVRAPGRQFGTRPITDVPITDVRTSRSVKAGQPVAPRGANSIPTLPPLPSEGRAAPTTAVRGSGEAGSTSAGTGETALDGTRVARWLARALAADAARPPAVGAGFDPRRTPAWAPSFYVRGT